MIAKDYLDLLKKFILNDQMTCEALGLKYNTISVDLMNGGTRTQEYMKMNPQHTVPTLKDGTVVITESKPAATYLIGKARSPENYSK